MELNCVSLYIWNEFATKDARKRLLAEGILTEEPWLTVEEELLEISSVGFCNIHNKCDWCSENLLVGGEVDSYIKNL